MEHAPPEAEPHLHHHSSARSSFESKSKGVPSQRLSTAPLLRKTDREDEVKVLGMKHRPRAQKPVIATAEFLYPPVSCDLLLALFSQNTLPSLVSFLCCHQLKR